LISTALIHAPERAGDVIFGRTLLERLMLVCERAGVNRFFIEVADAERAELRASMGSFRDSPDVSLVSSLAQALEHLPAEPPCVALRGNLVLSIPQLSGLIAAQAARPGGVVVLDSADDARRGTVAAGPPSRLGDEGSAGAARIAPTGQLPLPCGD
jgi:hypothetical protein